MLAIIDGRIIAEGFADPADDIIPIMEVGRSCRLEQERMMSIVIGKVTFPD